MTRRRIPEQRRPPSTSRPVAGSTSRADRRRRQPLPRQPVARRRLPQHPDSVRSRSKPIHPPLQQTALDRARVIVRPDPVVQHRSPLPRLPQVIRDPLTVACRHAGMISCPASTIRPPASWIMECTQRTTDPRASRAPPRFPVVRAPHRARRQHEFPPIHPGAPSAPVSAPAAPPD